MIGLATIGGLSIAGGTLAAILWSIARPDRRIWPPERYDPVWTPIRVWVPTFALAGIIVWLGVVEWGAISLPPWLRWGVGLPLILAANVAVWSEVAQFGVHRTGGAEGPLRTDGLYRWSRNPQYVADTTMVLGWILLSAAPSAALVGAAAIAILLSAPFSEERWMEERHGDGWRRYVETTPRYF